MAPLHRLFFAFFSHPSCLHLRHESLTLLFLPALQGMWGWKGKSGGSGTPAAAPCRSPQHSARGGLPRSARPPPSCVVVCRHFWNAQNVLQRCGGCGSRASLRASEGKGQEPSGSARRSRRCRGGGEAARGPGPSRGPHRTTHYPVQELSQHLSRHPAAMRRGLAAMFLLMAALGAAQARWVAPASSPPPSAATTVRRSPPHSALRRLVRAVAPGIPCLQHSVGLAPVIASPCCRRRRGLGEGRVQASIAGGQPAPVNRYRWNAMLRQVS